MGMLSKASSKSLALLAGITILFRWKTLLTHEFTILSEDETVNQAYSWYSFCLRVIRHGVPALWDLNSRATVSSARCRRPGSRLQFILAIFPPDSYGLLREQLYNWYIAALIFLALAFMYWLARDLGLSRMAATGCGCLLRPGRLSAASPGLARHAAEQHLGSRGDSVQPPCAHRPFACKGAYKCMLFGGWRWEWPCWRDACIW